jgi:pyruvate dehydrogenase E2 component (dihydrolipoamide acetyltransferase)
MAEEFFVPKLGQTVEEVTLVGWLVEDGAKVSQGEAVMEVETDKAVFPVEANAKGYIHLGPYKAGDTIPVLTVVAIIGKQDDKFEVKGSAPAIETEPAPSAEIPAPVAKAKSESADKVFVSPRAKKLAAETSVDVSKVTPSGYEGIRVTERDVRDYLAQQPKASPVAQRMAADVGVDLREVAGSGPGGRIIKQDVARASQPTVAPVSQALPVADVIERIPLKGVRGIIAERMGTSVHTTARVTLVMEVDATEFVAARERIKAKVSKDWGFAPGYNDLLAKVVAVALRQFPYMNARLAPDAIELMGHVNIGMAVDTERGLLVPVVKDADKKNLRQFGEDFRRMVDGARSGRSLPDDLTGGTFTITNLGMYDVDAFTPVINLPEAAILGVGRIAPKAVPLNNEVVIRQMWTLSLVFDHRLVDGAPAARFLQMIKSLIEDPSLLMMYM